MSLTSEQQALVKEIRLCKDIGTKGYCLGEPRDEVEAQRVSDYRQLFEIITAQAKCIEKLEHEVEVFKRVTVDLTHEKYTAEARVDELERTCNET